MTQPRKFNRWSLALALAAAATLAACGDSPPDDTPAPAETTVPASAQSSTAAWTDYTATRPASDMAEPLDVNASTPPVSETEEPRPV